LHCDSHPALFLAAGVFVAAVAMVSACGSRTGLEPEDASASEDAAAGAACGASGVFKLASADCAGLGLVVDATTVFWVDGETIRSIDKCGGKVSVLARGQPAAYFIAVNSDRVYWTNSVDNGSVVSVGRGGGTPTTLAAEQRNAAGIALDSTYVYWANRGPTVAPPIPARLGSILRMPLGGGSPTTLASRQASPASIALDETSIYWTNDTCGGPPNRCPLGALLRMSLDGGESSTVLSGYYGPTYVTIDSSAAFFLWGEGQYLGMVPLVGGQVSTLASQGASGLAVDGTSVYFSDLLLGTVLKTPSLGGDVHTLASRQTASAVAVDATSVYWANTDSIIKLTPK
jgi:Domain of unknown function (DUF5050)